MSVLTQALVARLLEKHGLPSATAERGAYEGVVNEVWFAGDVVIRVNKDLNYASDVWTETVAVPALTAHGINTPRLLAFDNDGDITERLVTIYKRAPGIPLSKVETLNDPEDFFHQLAKEVRSIHDRVTSVDDPNNLLDPEWELDEAAVFEAFPDSPDWLRFPAVEEPTVFGHQDLHADNILVHEGRFSAIIDWGDAGWVSPSVDLRYVPARYLRFALEGYGVMSPETRRRAIVHQMSQYLYAQSNNRSYGRFGDSTRQDVEALFA